MHTFFFLYRVSLKRLHNPTVYDPLRFLYRSGVNCKPLASEDALKEHHQFY